MCVLLLICQNCSQNLSIVHTLDLRLRTACFVYLLVAIDTVVVVVVIYLSVVVVVVVVVIIVLAISGTILLRSTFSPVKSILVCIILQWYVGG